MGATPNLDQPRLLGIAMTGLQRGILLNLPLALALWFLIGCVVRFLIGVWG